MALIFEKGSTRTRCAFEVAAADQGAHTTYLGPEGSHIGREESIADTAQVLGHFYDGIEFRGFAQETSRGARGVRQGARLERAHRPVAPTDARRRAHHPRGGLGRAQGRVVGLCG